MQQKKAEKNVLKKTNKAVFIFIDSKYFLLNIFISGIKNK